MKILSLRSQVVCSLADNSSLSMSKQNNSVLVEEESTRTSSSVAMGLIGGGFVTIVALTTPFITMQLKSSLPYMSTPRQKVEKALAFLSKRNQSMIVNKLKSKDTCTTNNERNRVAGFQKQLHFVDLGSGDGTAVLAAASLGWRAVGIEMNTSLWFLSSIRRLLFTDKKARINSQLKIGDMFDASTSQSILRNANCAMIFGISPLMPRIANLIERECQPGCWIMSYRFRVPLAKDSNDKDKKSSDQGLDPKGINASLIYDEEEMRIYELSSLDRVDEDKVKNND